MAEIDFESFLLKNCPNLDPDLRQYVQDVLATSGEDFEDGEQVFDALGGFLLEGQQDTNDSEDDIKSLCQQLYGLLKGEENKDGASNGQVILNAPVQMGQLIQEQEQERNSDQQASIWLHKTDDVLKVDKAKLEKAEQMLQKKQERNKDGNVKSNTNKYKSNEATATQVISRKDARAEASGNNNTKDIKIEEFSISFGDNVLLQSANLSLSFGRRYGMVGRNGLGKSTLLKMISS